MDAKNLDILGMIVLWHVLKTAKNVDVTYTQDIVQDAFLDTRNKAVIKSVVTTPTDQSALCPVVAATTENPVTISTVPVTLDAMKGWKATCVRKNVLLEPLDQTVAKNVDIVWERTTVIISMGAAKTGAPQDTKEINAKVRVPLALLELTVCTHAALSVEEIHRAII